MNQVAVFAGLLFWSWVGGIWGMLLAVPMMMAIKVICDHVEPLRRSHTYLASDTFQYSPPRSGSRCAWKSTDSRRRLGGISSSRRRGGISCGGLKRRAINGTNEGIACDNGRGAIVTYTPRRSEVAGCPY